MLFLYAAPAAHIQETKISGCCKAVIFYKLLTGHSPESNSLVFPAHELGSFPFSEIEVLLTYLHIVDPDDTF